MINSESASNMPQIAGGFLLLGFVIVMAGLLLYVTRRNVAMENVVGTARFKLERSLVMAAAILTVIGFVVLAEALRGSGGFIPTWIGAWVILLGGTILVVAEAMALDEGLYSYPLIVSYVVLALLGQAAIGYGLTRGTHVPPAVGWITVVWNLAFLIILPLATPKDVYFPILHHLMPFAIGVALLFNA